MGDTHPPGEPDVVPPEPGYCRLPGFLFGLQCVDGVDKDKTPSSGFEEYDTLSELEKAVGDVPDGQLMVLTASNTLDDAPDDLVTASWVRDEIMTSFDVLGAFLSPAKLLRCAEAELAKAAAHKAVCDQKFADQYAAIQARQEKSDAVWQPRPPLVPEESPELRTLNSPMMESRIEHQGFDLPRTKLADVTSAGGIYSRPEADFVPSQSDELL